MNYQSGMMVKGEDKPCTNAVVFATEKEANEAGKELLSRWFVPYDYTVVTTDDPVNYRFNFEEYRPERIEIPMGGINEEKAIVVETSIPINVYSQPMNGDSNEEEK